MEEVVTSPMEVISITLAILAGVMLFLIVILVVYKVLENILTKQWSSNNIFKVICQKLCRHDYEYYLRDDYESRYGRFDRGYAAHGKQLIKRCIKCGVKDCITISEDDHSYDDKIVYAYTKERKTIPGWE